MNLTEHLQLHKRPTSAGVEMTANILCSSDIKYSNEATDNLNEGIKGSIQSCDTLHVIQSTISVVPS
jgi:hypothetical protein